MKIIYIHHGNRKINIPPTPNDDLTELGYQDCQLVSKLLNNKNIKQNLKAIYTAKNFRCKKTSEIINKNLNLEILEDNRLAEYKAIKNETWVDLQKRIQNFINELTTLYDKNDIVICVTSGVNIVGFLNKAYNLPESENAPYIEIPSCSPIIFTYN